MSGIFYAKQLLFFAAVFLTNHICITRFLIHLEVIQQLFKIRSLTCQFVKNLMEQPGKVLVVDARTEEEYRKGHIPTAINIPPQQFSSIENHLPQDKNLTVIFYCRGYS